MNGLAVTTVTILAMGGLFGANAVEADSAKPKELSKVIEGLLTPEGQDIEKYEDLKKYIGNVAVSARSQFSKGYLAAWQPQYEGTISLTLHGKPYGADPMTDDNQWHVEIDGTDAAPVAIQISPVNATTDAGGIAYFKKAGFAIEAKSCENLDAGNYAVLYAIGYEERKPAYLEISSSTGTAGTFLSYTLFWNAPGRLMLPDGAQPEHCNGLKN